MSKYQAVREKMHRYIRNDEKAKLCVLDAFLERGPMNEYEVATVLNRYYPVNLFSISKIYSSLKADGLIGYDSSIGKDKLLERETLSSVFSELKPHLDVMISKDHWGKGDIMGTLDETKTYLLERILMRGALVPQETLLADIARDASLRTGPYYSYSDNLDAARIAAKRDVDELVKAGYLNMLPQGYVLPDFVRNDFLSNPFEATRILNALSRDLWMIFDYEPYLSLVRKLRDKYPKICDPILEGQQLLVQNKLNDSLDKMNAACEELTVLICDKILEEGEKAPSSFHAKVVAIWRVQDLWKDHPDLSELGKKAAFFLGSAIFIPKWIRDKTSHPLVTPTHDSVRLALASLLLAVHVAARLKLMEETRS